MALELINIEPKTGEVLAHIPERVVEHTYLEYRLKQAQATGEIPETVGLYVAGLYDSVNVADLEHLKATKGLHCIGSNRRNAYLVDDAGVAEWIQREIFTNISDPVAYFSVVMSPAIASTVRSDARILVMDDGASHQGSPAQKWGRRKPKDRDGKAIDLALLDQAHRLLGDGYCLIDPELHRQVSRESAVEAARRAVDAGQISLVQVHEIAGDELNEWQGEPVQTLLAVHLEEAISRALSGAGVSALDQSGVQVVELKPGRDSIRGEVAVGKWLYTDLERQTTYTGRVLLERRGGPGTAMTLTMLGGTQTQKQTVSRLFGAIAAADLTPFQLRGGVSEWQGAFKGTARSASLCQQLGVDVILPRSAIKADGKTVPLGISEVKDLFWARKSDARAGTQRLGTQVLVNLPQGTEVDVLPKLAERQAVLAQAMSDPRRLADLFCESYERRKAILGADGESDFQTVQSKNARTDWLYTLLKADSRPQTAVEVFDSVRWLQDRWPEAEPGERAMKAVQLQVVEAQLSSALLNAAELQELIADTLQVDPEQVGNPDDLLPYCETTQVGGYAQILEMPKVVTRLYEFAQSEWIDTMSGGLLVPSATAQPHALLRPGEVCFSQMPHGARVSVFRSPVANVGQMKVMTNNLNAIRTGDREAYVQQNVVYLNPDDAKAMVVDFDIDAVALIPDEAFVRAKPFAASDLQPGQCCVPTLQTGQAVTLYAGGEPVSLVNTAIEAGEAVGRSTIYLSEQQYEKLPAKGNLFYGYYDGLHGFKTLNDEVDYLTQPERRPAPVEKRTKIPRDANHPDVSKLSAQEQAIARSFTTLEQAIIHAADNPTGLVANAGMKLQALKRHLEASDTQSQIKQVKAASKEFRSLLKIEGEESAFRQTFRVPSDLPEGYSFRRAMQDIAQVVPPATKCALMVAQLQQADDTTLLEVIQRMQTQYRRCLGGDLEKPQFLPAQGPQEYSFEREVQWLRDGHRYLTASSEPERAEQARRVIVPRLVKLLEQLDQLPDQHHKGLRVPLTNYQKRSDVERYEDSLGDDAMALRRVPDLKRLLEVIQHRLIDPELQIAVETDKSGRAVNPDVLHFARKVADYQEVDWIKDKKREDLYLPQINPRTGGLEETRLPLEGLQDPIGQIVAQTNRYFRSAQGYVAQPAMVYRDLVPLPEPGRVELWRSAQSVVRDYYQMIAPAKARLDAGGDNPGPQLVIQIPHLGQPLRVTNLIRFDPKGVSPLWEALRCQQPFEVELRLNQSTELQGVRPRDCNAYQTQEKGSGHRFQVVGRFGGANAEPGLYSLGTLAEESAVWMEQNGLDLTALLTQPLSVEQVALMPNLDKEQAREIVREAEENLVQWAEAVSITPQEQEAAFRAIYHASRPIGGVSRDSEENRSSMTLALRLFPQQVMPYLKHYSLTPTRATGVNHYSQQWQEAVGELPDWQGQEVPVRVAVMDDPDHQMHGRLVWQVGFDLPHPDGGYQRHWQTVGTVHQNNLEPDRSTHDSEYRLPVGVEAVARVVPLSPRYQITSADGLKLSFAVDENHQQRLRAMSQQSVRLGVEREPGQPVWKVMLYESPTQPPVAVGSLTRDSAQLLKSSSPRPGKARLSPQDYQISALPLQAARLEMLPQSVQRPQQWVAPTVDAWRTFVAQEQQHPIRMEHPQYSLEDVLGRSVAMQPSETTVGGEALGQVGPTQVDVNPEVKLEVRPEVAQWQERYQTVFQRVAPALEEAATRHGKLRPEIQDIVIAVQMLKDRLQENPRMDVQRDPVNVDIIRTLAVSPEAQARLQSGGRQSMCDYINTQMRTAQKQVKTSRESQPQTSKAGER